MTEQRTQPARARETRQWRRYRSDNDVALLARSWAAEWVAGAPIGRWLKHHVDEMSRLIHTDGWSWQDLTEAMNQAGIFYRTGRPWSADLLSDKAARARRELRAVRTAQGSEEYGPRTLAQPGEGLPSARPAELPFPVFDPDEVVEPIVKEPEFKFATLRGWYKPQPLAALPAQENKPGGSKQEAEPQPEIDVDAALREFLARPRYGAIPMPEPLEPEDD